MRYRFNAPSHHTLELGDLVIHGGEEFEYDGAVQDKRVTPIDAPESSVGAPGAAATSEADAKVTSVDSKAETASKSTEAS